MLFAEGCLVRDIKHGDGALLTICKFGCATCKELLGTIQQNVYREQLRKKKKKKKPRNALNRDHVNNILQHRCKPAVHKSGGAKDTLKAVSSEGQSSVVAGLALCAASAGPRVCALLRWWSHTADTNTSRNKQTLTNQHFLCRVH